MKLRFKKLDERAQIPEYAHEGDSGMDIRCLEDFVAVKNDVTTVSTGIAADIPEGCELQVRPRSGLTQNGIIAQFGTVDSVYRGEIKIAILNIGPYDFTVQHGYRIAQLVLAPVVRADIEEIPQGEQMNKSERGSNGFGSTGIS